jgi:two-component system, OmpR family, alkaline phosphatase synthesis response regulator PhoP
LTAASSADVQLILADLLRSGGYDVVVSGSGEDGLQATSQRQFDLLILDVMLPGMDGFATCRSIRQNGFDGAVLMLTARTHVDDRVDGLHSGADDYLIKPFDPKELLARVSALLRRLGKSPLTPVLKYQFGDVAVDFERREVTRAGLPVNLAAKELLLLRHLIDHRGSPVSRDRLLARIWQDQPFIGARTVDVHVAWLRQKLEANPQSPRYIVTVRGEGYSFQP